MLAPTKEQTMKKPLKIILIVLAVLVLAFALWLLLPRHKLVTDASDYGRYNKVTREMLADFSGILPESIPENAQDTEYSYEYLEEIDRSFVIDLKYNLDEESYYAEKSRLGHLAEDSRLIDGKRYYICSTGDLEEFFNDVVLDGCNYKVEVAVCYDETHSIEYLVSSCAEGMSCPDTLENVLRPIYDDDISRSNSDIPKIIKKLIKSKVE